MLSIDAKKDIFSHGKKWLWQHLFASYIVCDARTVSKEDVNFSLCQPD